MPWPERQNRVGFGVSAHGRVVLVWRKETIARARGLFSFSNTIKDGHGMMIDREE
jgi:hypothetical protein